MPDKNTLYYGDNLEVLRRYVKDESVDLVYLDPPFNSAQDYNVLFAERDGAQAAAQIKAFEDTWRWGYDAEKIFHEVVEAGGTVSEAMQAFRRFLGPTDMLAYLTMMAPRLVELRRVLKETGSIYLHCDPTASHYLKMLMDGVFGAASFRNEIVWRRSHPKGHASTRFATCHDVILAYTKVRSKARWHPQYLPHDPKKVAGQYGLMDKDGRRYQLTSLLNPNPNRPNLTYEFKGVVKVWRWTKERMAEEDGKGRIVVPKGGQSIPRYKRYLDEQPGIPISDWWGDIEIAVGDERLGYPTQKPEALLERIVSASSTKGDLVLDPFCGCGTAIAVAQRLKRRWIGIDITPIAVTLIKARLRDTFGNALKYDVVGEPVTAEDAAALAKQDPYHFQYWALGLVGGRPHEEKRGMDRGIDGRLYFHDDARAGKTKQIVLSVKAGHVLPTHVRDLRGVVEREDAAIGVFITLEEPSKQMLAEAAGAGFYRSPMVWQGRQDFPRLQILTVAELLEGKRIDYPAQGQTNVTFRRAPKAKSAAVEEPEIFDDIDENADPEE